MISNKTMVLVAVTLVVLQVWLVQVGHGAVIRPPANPNYNDSAAAAANTTEPFTIYQTTTVIVHAVDNATGHQWKATFYPRIDEFSQLEIPGTFNTSMTFNPNLLIFVEFNGQNLTQKHVYTPDNNLFIPYFTAVVLLNRGNVASFQWQDGCGNCKTGDCLDNSCGIERFSGTTDVCTQTDCNIKVYFAWSGRDALDNACKSINSTPAKFDQYSLTPTVNFGTGLFNDFIYTFTSTAPNPLSQQP